MGHVQAVRGPLPAAPEVRLHGARSRAQVTPTRRRTSPMQATRGRCQPAPPRRAPLGPAQMHRGTDAAMTCRVCAPALQARARETPCGAPTGPP